MYWSRTGSFIDLFAWLLLSSVLWAGGYLLCTYVFRLRLRERLLAGLASGLLLFIVFSNLLAYLLPLDGAFWSAAFLILALGGISAWRYRSWNKPEVRNWRASFGHVADWRRAGRVFLPQILALAGLIFLFTLINRGLGIFDDYFNLPLLSHLAAGDFPPHFHLNVDHRLAHHYGLHLYAASLIRVAGFFPWSAFDLARTLSISLAPLLAWLWVLRVTRNRIAAFLAALIVLMGGGARWLLLFGGETWLIEAGTNLHMLGSGAISGPDLYTALFSPWKIEGDGPFPFPFAFANGIFIPTILALGGSAALTQMTLPLLLLLGRRNLQPHAAILFGLILASLALTAEHVFVLASAGWAVAALIEAIHRRSFRHASLVFLALLPGFVLASTAGGVITEIVRGALEQLTGAPTAQNFGFSGFSIQWPPAILSGHLGPLRLSNPKELLIALAEVGPAILLAPAVILCCWKLAKRGNWAPAGLGLGALLVFLFTLVASYGVERDISRLTGSALYTWMLLGIPLAWSWWQSRGSWVKVGLGIGFGALILGGAVLFAIQLIAISRPQFTYFIETPDAALSRSYWGKLEQGAQIFDPEPFRAVTLFGNGAGKARQDIYTPLDEWADLLRSPDPVQMAQYGYSYVYFEKTWWQGITLAQKRAFQQPCVKQLAEQVTDDRDYRRLLDITGCRP